MNEILREKVMGYKYGNNNKAVVQQLKKGWLMAEIKFVSYTLQEVFRVIRPSRIPFIVKWYLSSWYLDIMCFREFLLKLNHLNKKRKI